MDPVTTSATDPAECPWPGKVRHKSRRDACRHATELLKANGTRMRVYRCPAPPVHWHTSTQTAKRASRRGGGR